MYVDIFFRLAPRLRVLGDARQPVLFNPDLPAWTRLNKTGLAVLQHCDGHTSVAELANTLSTKFRAPRAAVERDVAVFMERVFQLGFVYQDADAWARRMRRVNYHRQLTFEEYRDMPAQSKRLNLEITQRCNLHCVHCYANAGPEANASLPPDVISRQLDALTELGVDRVSLSGGEPLMHPDIWAIIDILQDAGFLVGIATNGILVTEQVARKLAATSVGVQVSFDGATPTTHNAVRGPRAFERSLRAIQNLRHAGILERVTLAFTPLSTNVAEIDAVVELALSLGVPTLRMNRLCNNGRAADGNFRPAESAAVDFYLHLQEFQKTYSNRISIKGDLLESVRLKRKEAAFSNCALGEALKIDPEGYVFACAQFTDRRFALGNIHCKLLTDLLPHNRVLRRLRTIWYRRFTSRRSACTACDWRLICKGGCMAEAYAEHGTFWASDPLCAARKATIEAALLEAAG